MTPRARRIIIPFVVILASAGVVLSVIMAPPTKPAKTAQTSPTDKGIVAQTSPAEVTPSGAAATQPATKPEAAAVIAPASTQPVGLHAVAAGNDLGRRDVAPQPLGSLDPRRSSMRVDLTRRGAGIAAIRYSEIWETAEAKRKDLAYRKTLAPDAMIDPSQLDEQHRYILQSTQPYIVAGKPIEVPVMAAHSIVVNGNTIVLLNEALWSETAVGRFETRIVDANDSTILEIARQLTLSANYDIYVALNVRNVSNQPLDIKWQQYGPVELNVDKSGYIDQRKFDFGFLPSPQSNPGLVLSKDNSLTFERSDVIKAYGRSIEPGISQQQALAERRLWPNRASMKNGYGLSWFASTNRYFGLAIHPVLDAQGGGSRSLANVVDEIRLDVSNRDANGNPIVPHLPEMIFTFLVSPMRNIAPGTETGYSMGVYAGPLDRHILGQEPYNLLAMEGLIIYQMSSCCSFLTFQWLAHLLLWFLSFLHDYILLDWGLAIIGLVVVVRAILHPLTKKSQINMQRFGKNMAAMKPEIDKIQKKHAGDPKRAQQEQMALMREHGVNPLHILGCLPMFLQTPIWIALWAMLYLAFDIRQQPAFYGVFQLFGGWNFLGDLSRQDHFITLPGAGFQLPLFGTISAINLLPLLMGFVFFFQQKYMSPPPTPNMTPEQIQQQKIMKVMMVVMFPLMLYGAPCGLTLYIFTSSCIGILESKYIRKHIDQLDSNPTKPRAPTIFSKIKDARARAYAEAIERAKSKRDAEPQRSFKKRK